VSPAARFTIGDFRIDPRRNVVQSAAGETPLEPKIMDVLCLLAAHPGEVMAREGIIDAVWGHAYGADESLTRAISQLRKVFGDTPAPARFIETISKRGYRLIAPVSVEPEPSAPVARRRWKRSWIAVAVAALALTLLVGVYLLRESGSADPVPDGIAVTVVPFDPLSADQRVGARTISDQVAVALSRASLLHVAKGNPASTPRDFSYRLRGTVQRVSGSIRVTVEILGQGGENVWAGIYDRPAPLGRAGQDELVGAMSAEINNRLLVAAKTAIRRLPLESLKPWQLTLLATWVPGSDEVFLRPHGADSLWPQRRALALDPNYAPAHASLASALAYRALFTPGADTASLRREAAGHAELAKAIAPYDVGVLYELATYYRLIGDRAGANAALQHVIAIQPDHPVARYDLPFVQSQCTVGSGSAVARLDAALATLAPDNPVRWVLLSHLADLHLARGDTAAAAKAAGGSRAIVRMTWSGVTLAAALAQQGRDADALRVSRETKLEWPGLDWGRFATTMTSAWCLGGEQQQYAAAAFHRLAAIEQPAHKRP
jgi:DNA-binding winged helix-turn-helix (wHTH) protein/TolB-like protein